VLDAGAGYWVSERDAAVLEVRRVDDCFAAIAETGAELRLTPDLWPYVDAVRAGAAEFSAIRMRNAQPRRPPAPQEPPSNSRDVDDRLAFDA
jgi:hypothetical protein